MKQELAGKVIVITGASAGLGRATAIAFGREGAKVGLIARSEDGLRSAAEEVERAGSQAAWAMADVADDAQLAQAATRLEEALGPVDIWVNNAMATIFSPFIDITPEEYRRVTEVTYLGTVHGTMEALKRMLPRGRGTIIQVGSALAYRSIPLQSAYCGAKAAIRGFTDSLRCEFIRNKRNIDLVAVHMSALNTPQFGWARSHIEYHPQPVPPIFAPEVGADAIVFAAQHPRREYWVGGPSWQAIIGAKFAPGLTDRMMARKAYEGQWLDEKLPGGRKGNLFETPPEGHAARGRFTDRSQKRSTAWEWVKRIMKQF